MVDKNYKRTIWRNIIILILLILMVFGLSKPIEAQAAAEVGKIYWLIDGAIEGHTTLHISNYPITDNYKLLDESKQEPPWWDYDLFFAIIENEVKPTTTRRWFYYCEFLREIKNLNYLNTENVTNMEEMFDTCRSLKDLDLSTFNTSKVTTMYSMFFNCNNLINLDLGDNFDTSNVTNMNLMFTNCFNLVDLDLGGKFDTSSVTSMRFMFSNYNSANLYLGENFDTSNVTDMEGMFRGGYGLINLDIGEKFDTSNVINMRNMFCGCSKLASLDLREKFDTSNVTNMFGMFDGCSSLAILNLGEKFSISKIPVTNYTFVGAGEDNPAFKIIFKGKNTQSNIQISSKMYDIRHNNTVYDYFPQTNITPNGLDTDDPDDFYELSKTPLVVYWWYDNATTTLHFSSTQINSNYKMNLMIGGKYNSNGEIVSAWDWNGGTSTSVDISADITKVVIDDDSYSTYYSFMLAGCKNVKEIANLVDLHIEYATDTRAMFYNCWNLKELDLSTFDTSRVKDMQFMFYECSNLTRLDLGGSFNTSKVTNMAGMFYNCKSLTSLNLGETFNTSKVTNADYLFYNTGLSNPEFKIIFKGTNTKSNISLPSKMYDMRHNGKSYSILPQTNITPNGLYTGDSDDFYELIKTSTSVYWWYDAANTTLHFSSTPINSQYALIEESTLGNYASYTPWYVAGYHKNITSVIIDNEIRPTKTKYWFYDCSALADIKNLSYLHTENVKEMQNMFRWCNSLTTLDLRSFNTSNVINMQYMFYDCSKLTRLELGDNFNTSKVTDMQYMFSDCPQLKELDLSAFNTGNVKNMWYMFYNCTSLTSLKLGDNFDTSNTTNMKCMFSNCSKLTSLNLGGKFDTSSVTDMGFMFYECNNLANLELGETFNTSKVTDMTFMFYRCLNLTKLELGAGFDTSNVNDTDFMFTKTGAYAQEFKIIFKGTNTKSNVTLPSKMYDIRHNNTVYSILPQTNITPNGLDASKPGDYYELAKTPPTVVGEVYWWYDSTNTTLHFSHYPITDNYKLIDEATLGDYNSWTPWYTNAESITTVKFDNEVKPTKTNHWFYGCSALTSFTNFSNLNTENVTEMQDMFYSCEMLPNLDLSRFNTSKVATMSTMFYNCKNLINLDLSSFDTSNVASTYAMFSRCSSLTSLNLGENFDTSSVTDMSSMFYKCSSLTSLELGEKFDTSKISDANAMFTDCKKLTSLDLGEKFYTNNVTRMDGMFYGCSGLTNLNLGVNFDTSKVRDTVCMFSGCSSLTSLNLGEKFDTSKVTDMRFMFSECTNLGSLVLGKTFDTNNVVNMRAMFITCTSLKNLDLGENFNTSKVTDMRAMFEGCSSLTSLELKENFNTSKVTDISYMFAGCSSLNDLDLGDSWNTSKVTNMSSLFYKCTNLTSLKLGEYFDTSEVTAIDGMFNSCSKLTSLDLGTFDTSKVTKSGGMLSGCSSLLELKTPKAGITTIDLPFEMVEHDNTTLHTKMPNNKTLCKPVKVSYNYSANGGSSVSVASEKRAYNATLTDVLSKPVVTATKSGYNFVGWNTDANATTKLSSYTLSGSDVTFYAIFSKSCKVTFKDFTSAQQSTDLVTTFYNKTTSWTVKAPVGNTYPGWEWRGWSSSGVTTANATVKYANGESITLSSDQTFYGLYQKTTTINYDSNGGPTQTATSGTFYFNAAGNYQNPSVSLPSITRSGYQLLGWSNTKQEPNIDETKLTVNYKTDANLVDLMKTTNGSKTIYAVWKKFAYSITYTLDGGRLSGQKTSYTVTDAAFTLPTPVKTGYTFTGWTGSNGTTPQKTVTIASGSSGNKAYTANWTPNVLTLRAYINGGDVVPGGSYTLKSDNTWWVTKPSYDGTLPSYGLVNPLTSRVFRVGYTPNSKNYNSKADGTGTVLSSYTVYTCQELCTLLGVDLSVGSKTAYVYTQWIPNTYSINYNGNGATSGTVGTSTHTYDKSKALTANSFSRTGFTFVGWNTKADGTGTSYTNKQSVINLTSVKNEVITLYAQWEEKSFSVVIEPNGGTYNGSTGATTISKKYSETITVNNDSITRDGYKFIGWYSASKGGTKYTGSLNFTNRVDTVTLYAHWDYAGKYTSSSIGVNNEIALVSTDGQVFVLGTKQKNPDLITDGSYKTKLNISGIDEAEYVNGDLYVRAVKETKAAKVTNANPTFTSTPYLWNSPTGVIGNPASKFGSVQGTCVAVDTNNKVAIYKITKDNVDYYKLVESIN